MIDMACQIMVTELFVQQLVELATKVYITCPFVMGRCWLMVDSPHKGPVMQEAFPCNDVMLA